MRTILFLMRKEALQVLRDKITRIQLILPPVIQLLVLSQAATFEVKHTRMVLVDSDKSPAAHRLVEAFTASGRFEMVALLPSMAAADRTLLNREASVVLRVPPGFERDLRSTGVADVQLVLNAEDGAAAGVVQSYAVRILDRYGRQEGATLRPVVSGAPGVRAGPQLDVRARGWFNPEGDYLDYMALGFLAMLMTIIGTLLTAQNIAREKERGTLEQLNATPITRGQFIAGKLLPFWVLGLFELTLGLVVIKVAFGTPFVGSLGVVYLGAALYLVAALGVGLLISTVAETQQQAMFVTFFVLVIYIFLSGLFTPIQSMPEWVQWIAACNPIRYFVVIVRGALMKGASLSELAPSFGALALFGVAAMSVALLRYRKTSA
jgi:ABC-2 type transport system permease protein